MMHALLTCTPDWALLLTSDLEPACPAEPEGWARPSPTVQGGPGHAVSTLSSDRVHFPSQHSVGPRGKLTCRKPASPHEPRPPTAHRPAHPLLGRATSTRDHAGPSRSRGEEP